MRSTRTTSVRIAVGALAAASTLALVAAAPASAAGKARGYTAVTLSDAGAAVLGALNVAPVGPAFDPEGAAQVAFPIVGNFNKGVAHVGGLALSDDEGGSLVLTNYLVSGIPGTLSAKAEINDMTTLQGVPVFSVDGGGDLRLTSAAVDAVVAVFGTDEIGPILATLPDGVAVTDVVIGTAAPMPR